MPNVSADKFSIVLSVHIEFWRGQVLPCQAILGGSVRTNVSADKDVHSFVCTYFVLTWAGQCGQNVHSFVCTYFVLTWAGHAMSGNCCLPVVCINHGS